MHLLAAQPGEIGDDSAAGFAAGDRIFDKVYWTALRTIRKEDPIKIAGLAKVALRIKATDQLNGVVDQFNAGFRKAHQDGTIGRILAAHQMKEVPQKSWEGR